jgi:tRNA(Ile)-lysidine synthase
LEGPIRGAEFSRLMAALGPFEDRPTIAAAVSGGADSMALILLLDRWARARGGAAIALTVDHRLRPAATAEARQVAAWLAARGIAQRSLTWAHGGARPRSALQAQARLARYRLLAGWCRRRGVLHLALAHHAGDQAETVLMRLARGAGIDGLAGMSASLARDGVRVIRPRLLSDPLRLRASLAAAGQDWIEDPSNRDERFERVRWRRLVPPDQRLPIALAAAEIGAERRRREHDLADLLARARLTPGGDLDLPLAPLLAAPPALALAALARCLIAVGGQTYPPRRASLERLLAGLAAGGPARTLGGCRVPVRGGRLRATPEAPAVSRGKSRAVAKIPVPEAHLPLVPGSFTVAKLNVNIM